jgi:hypothetical protein
MVAVRVMKAPVHEIIDMVAMRHRLVAAVGAVTVFGTMAGGVVFGIAAIRIPVAYRDRVLMRPTVLAVFKAAVVEVIHVPFVPHREMTAARTVHMRGTFAGRFFAGWHCSFLSPRAQFVQPMARRQQRKHGVGLAQRVILWNERPVPHVGVPVNFPSACSRSARRFAPRDLEPCRAVGRVHRQRCRRPSLPRKVPVAGSYDRKRASQPAALRAATAREAGPGA